MTVLSALQLPFTDLVLIAGLIIVLLFAVRLFLRRQKSETDRDSVKPSRKMRNFIPYALRLIGFTVVSFIIIGGSVLLYEDYKVTEEDIAPAPSQVEIPSDLTFRVEEITFTGGDDLKMAGWFVPPRNDATIILLHGYGGNRTGMLWHAEKLIQAGYGVLMYDERASGESAGKNRSYGWQDAPDIGGAIRYLASRAEVNPQRIGIAGCSIGAQIALQGAAHYPGIQAVWADGPSGILSSDYPPPHNWATGIAALSNYVLDWMYTVRLNTPTPAPMTAIIGKIAPRPIMMVAGGTPHPHFGAEAARVEYLARHAGANAKVWIIPEAYHCDGPAQRPDEYATRMIGFFDAAFDAK
ncbi:Quorum-quenching protein AidA [Anaerolineae bacterium]|nr:Quorum-quenching protein AidA [Anaerolineae bacterium]